MNIKGLIITIVLGVLIFLAGFGVSMLYKSPSVVTQNQSQNQQLSQTVSELSSRIVPSIAAYGSVTNINGKNLTLRYQGDSMMIEVMSDAKVYSYTPPSAGSGARSTTSQIDFSSIKTGDNVSVNIKVLPNGQIEGLSVIVLPPVTPVTVTPSPTPSKTPIKKY